MSYVVVEENSNVTIGQNKKADFLERVVIIPLSKTPGRVYLKDGNNSEIIIYPGLGNLLSIPDLTPIAIDFGMQSSNGGWSVRSESHVQAIVIGDF